MSDALALLRRLEKLLQRFMAAADAADPAQQVRGQAQAEARRVACSCPPAGTCSHPASTHDTCMEICPPLNTRAPGTAGLLGRRGGGAA